MILVYVDYGMFSVIGHDYQNTGTTVLVNGKVAVYVTRICIIKPI